MKDMQFRFLMSTTDPPSKQDFKPSTLSSLINDPYGITDPEVSIAQKNMGPTGNKRPLGPQSKKLVSNPYPITNQQGFLTHNF